MSKQNKQDKRDLMKARNNYHGLKAQLIIAEIQLGLHEAARSNGKRPPKHVRGL